MKVYATLDYIDGTSVLREVHLEVVPRFSAMWLMDEDVAGVTFTRKRPLMELSTKLKGKQHD